MNPENFSPFLEPSRNHFPATHLYPIRRGIPKSLRKPFKAKTLSRLKTA